MNGLFASESQTGGPSQQVGGENVGVVQPIHRIKRKDPVLKVNDVPTSLC
jgi:hypothetical protein